MDVQLTYCKYEDRMPGYCTLCKHQNALFAIRCRLCGEYIY